ncbi:hypothetical protein RSOLAG22IIIB_09115 [Rhizoctonia solani]|uniref:Laminin domain protein n=1 Tax=Rhizoctonia solani TaxID=456999 RepID=A0A0K6FWY7_9AGAM|nr:hypothetical protein RSOLAG22IIIB_09115 [Rhizoctonia solani]
MIAETPRIPRINNYVYTPPILPAHLSSVYDLKPIVGQPTDEQVKAIHAVIGAVDAGSRVPNLYGPDLSLQLSQHLFSVQMAVYRKSYPVNVFPGDNTYTPPSLPAYVPFELDPIVGAPSKDQLKAAQHAMRAVESLGNGPLFDSELTMRLSQHVFNLQFAQYIQDSIYGEFVPDPTEYQRAAPLNQGVPNPPAPINTDEEVPPEPIPTDEPTTRESSLAAAIKEQGQVMNDMKELMSESKGVLETMSRVLIAIQRSQTMVAGWDTTHIVHANPVNQQGLLATECGLPQLRYSCVKDKYWHNMDSNWLAGYLKFFNIGEDLLEGGEPPRLKGGDDLSWQAWLRVGKHLGFPY